MVYKLLAVCTGFGLVAFTAPITVASYDMPNGQGQASGGTFNYWDLNYSGAGATNTDGSPLTGGLGDLTDGFIALNNWSAAENAAGTGPYVGWRSGFTSNPLITFRFAGPVNIDTITFYVDDSDGDGGVTVPLSFEIGLSGGPLTTFNVADPSGSAPASYVFSGLGLSGNAVDIRLNHRTGWVFVSEVTFADAEVPEPKPGLLFAAGLAMLVILYRSSNSPRH